MTWEEWEEKYKPIKNTLVQDAPYDEYMFETYGNELDFVKDKCKDDAYHLWTILEAEGNTFLSIGFHWVNRQGYILTEIPWTEEESKVWTDILID